MKRSESRLLTEFYRQLIKDSITEDAPATEPERAQFVKDTFEAEMVRPNTLANRGYSQLMQDWLQGLCSTVEIPFYNHDIIALHEKWLGREFSEQEKDKILDEYWVRCAIALKFYFRNV